MAELPARPVVRHALATPADADLDSYVPPEPMLEIDRATMAPLGKLADLRREHESAVIAAAVAALHAATFADRRPRSAGEATVAGCAPSHPCAGR